MPLFFDSLVDSEVYGQIRSVLGYSHLFFINFQLKKLVEKPVPVPVVPNGEVNGDTADDGDEWQVHDSGFLNSI